MELEFQFHDDNTSCSSSTFSISEDFDDLRLGADANTFTAKYEDDLGDRPVHKFEIMKQQRNQYDQNDLNYTVSTISSISDLIDAREGDPEDLLLGLGFVPFEGEESHTSILSRFSSLPLGNKEIELQRSQQCDQHHASTHHHAIGPTVHNGILKTREWLASQDNNMNIDSSSSSCSKDSSSGSIKNNGALHSKRIPPQKKRHRWSKSRQSSFEHLLPNLEEEAGTDETADKSDSSSASLKDKHITPIRESSQEKENYSPKRDKHYSEKEVLGNKALYQKLNKLEKQQTFDRGGESHEVSDLCTTSPQANHVLINQIEPDDIPPDRLLESEIVEKLILTEPLSSPARLSPWKQLGRKNILNMVKVDSFELEEIVSNDGRLSPDVATLPHRLKHIGVEEIKKSTQHGENIIVRPSRISNTLSSSEEDVSSALSHSDTSSGFDEESEEVVTPVLTLCEKVDTMTSEKEHAKLYESEPIPNITEHLPKSESENKTVLHTQKFDDFCSSRSRIACASGVAEYALRFGKIQSQIRGLRAASCSDIQALEDRFSENVSSYQTVKENGTETEYTSSISAISNMKGKIPTNSCFSKNTTRRHSRTVQTPLNCNNNNIKQQRLPSNISKLYRYSSMPILSATSPSPVLSFRKTSCQSSISHSAKNAESKADSSLMSSISDVTYLSYQSSHNTRESARRNISRMACKHPKGSLQDVKALKSRLINGISESSSIVQDPYFLSSHKSHIMFKQDSTRHSFCCTTPCLCNDKKAMKNSNFDNINDNISMTR
ncbi:uncharacterized protein LOC120329626 isoform X2 [Styela clava]